MTFFILKVQLRHFASGPLGGGWQKGARQLGPESWGTQCDAGSKKGTVGINSLFEAEDKPLVEHFGFHYPYPSQGCEVETGGCLSSSDAGVGGARHDGLIRPMCCSE